MRDDRARIRYLRGVLEALLAYYREPDSDLREHCRGCDRSPYQGHAPDCRRLLIREALRRTDLRVRLRRKLRR